MSEIKSLILQDAALPRPDVQLETLIKNSFVFQLKFPVDTARCKTLQRSVEKDVLEANINSAYPVLHESVVELYAKFILDKRKNGSSVEKLFYKDFTVLMLVQRFLEKRAAIFVDNEDYYILLDGSEGEGGWKKVGTDSEEPPLTLQKCLSYDEMKLSALLSVSSHTYFINGGCRKNCGTPEVDRTKIEENGVVVGLIGPRMTKPNVMEHQDIIFSPISFHTMPKLMQEFYNVSYASGVTRLQNNPDCVRIKYYKYFDNDIYKKRLAISFDTFLLEANQRAKDLNTSAFVHVVGIGLGVWRISSHQEAVFLDEFVRRIIALGENLQYVSDVRFGHFDSSKCGQYASGETIPIKGHPDGGIKVQLSFRDPYLKLKGKDAGVNLVIRETGTSLPAFLPWYVVHTYRKVPIELGKLLVASFALDSNALPGNAYWGGILDDTSDAAAACSTQITELHNAHINPKCSKDSLRVATKTGVVTFSEYQDILRETINK